MSIFGYFLQYSQGNSTQGKSDGLKLFKLRKKGLIFLDSTKFRLFSCFCSQTVLFSPIRLKTNNIEWIDSTCCYYKIYINCKNKYKLIFQKSFTRLKSNYIIQNRFPPNVYWEHNLVLSQPQTKTVITTFSSSISTNSSTIFTTERPIQPLPVLL